MSHPVKRYLTVLLFVVVLLIGILFFVNNNQSIELSYLLGVINLPLSVLLLLDFIIGVVIGVIALLPLVLKLKYQKSRLEKKIKSTETEVKNLRVLPVKEPL